MKARGRLTVRLLPKALLVAVLLLPPGCSLGRRDFREDYARATAGKQGGELLAALVALDQQHPRQPSLKVNLGALCLSAGDLAGAAAYLERAEQLAAALGHRRDRHLHYLLQANLAELRLRTGRPEESAAHASRALALGEEDEIGVVFTRAKAWLLAGEPAAAVADFAAGRSAARVMNLEDYEAYTRALVGMERPVEALAVYEEQRRNFGYQGGQGLQESLLYEQLGRLGEAVLSAFLELEHRRGRGLEADRIRQNLAELSRRLEARQATSAVQIVACLKSYFAGDWSEAQARLAGALPAQMQGQDLAGGQPHLSLRYLRLALRLEQGAAGSELASYVQLEPELHTLAVYYYHLWRGLRRAGGAYGFASARPLLEKTVLLGRGSAFAGESREELGRLLGLQPSQGRRLLLAQEVQALVRRAIAEGPPEMLEPVLSLLGLPDSPYTMEAQILLRQAAAAPPLRAYLEQSRAAADGELRRHLAGLLGP